MVYRRKVPIRNKNVHTKIELKKKLNKKLVYN